MTLVWNHNASLVDLVWSSFPLNLTISVCRDPD